MPSLRTILATALVALLAPASASAQTMQPRIVGGKNAPAGTYDAVANITFSGFGCSGTLISAQWVLTAGHCGSITGEVVGTPIDYPADSYDVVLGTTDAAGAGGSHYTVDQLKHPSQYLLTSGYDLTLLHLTTAATQTPVKVAGTGYEPLWKPGVMETTAGFGTTDESGTTPKTMQVAQVPIVDDATCAAAYPDSPSSPTYPAYFESASQICAGYPQGGTDTCQGDSGGPLFGHDVLGGLLVVGATSYGNGCARAGYPGVYARVADTALREWIRSVVPDAIADATAPIAAPTPEPTATPVPTTTPTPSGGGGSVPSAPASGGRFGIDVPAIARKTLARRGLQVRISCSGTCSVKLALRVDGATRRALGLRSPVIGRAALTVPARVRGTASIRLAHAVAKRLASFRRERLTVTARFTAPAGPLGEVRRRVRFSRA